VHLSDIQNREEWRKISVIADIAIKQISGLKKQSYILGLEALAAHIRSEKK
jgi:3-dehydroquinate dehydratase-2